MRRAVVWQVDSTDSEKSAAYLCKLDTAPSRHIQRTISPVFIWRLCWNWGCQVQLSRDAKELMQFSSSPSRVLDIYVRCDAAGCLVGSSIPRILPWPMRSRVTTSHVYRRNYNLAFSSWISSYHTEYSVWVLSLLLHIWHVLGSNIGCLIWSSAWLKTPLPLPPDCQSVSYCSSRCVYIYPPTEVHKSGAPCLCGKILYRGT
jgi:hypothetical protein